MKTSELRAGPELKLQYADFHLHQMVQSLNPPATAASAMLEASGGVVAINWHMPFYAHFDAFLSATRSVAEIIKCCFGIDSHPAMKNWLSNMQAEERGRRREFSKRYQVPYDVFCRLRLGTARHISEHRIGYPPVTVTVSGMFGVTYTGGPAKQVPASETRQIDDPSFAWLAKPRAVRPKWSDFDIEGMGLFPACQDYLKGAQDLAQQARFIADQVHGDKDLTPPQ